MRDSFREFNDDDGRGQISALGFRRGVSIPTLRRALDSNIDFAIDQLRAYRD